MLLRIVQNEEKYYEFIRILRTHSDNVSGFVEKVDITKEQQKKYMEKYRDQYYICINEANIPVGWIGVVERDIRLCTDPKYKGQGVGKFMLNELYSRHQDALAKVLLSNEPSNQLFLSCGYQIYKQDEIFKYYIKNS